MNLFLTHQDFILQAQGELVGSGMSLHTHTHTARNGTRLMQASAMVHEENKHAKLLNPRANMHSIKEIGNGPRGSLPPNLHPKISCKTFAKAVQPQPMRKPK